LSQQAPPPRPAISPKRKTGMCFTGHVNRPISRKVPLALRGAQQPLDVPERDVSLTTTLFLRLRLGQNTQLYFDPEIAGGRGFGGVNGIADAPNGELPRVA